MLQLVNLAIKWSTVVYSVRYGLRWKWYFFLRFGKRFPIKNENGTVFDSCAAFFFPDRGNCPETVWYGTMRVTSSTPTVIIFLPLNLTYLTVSEILRYLLNTIRP